MQLNTGELVVNEFESLEAVSASESRKAFQFENATNSFIQYCWFKTLVKFISEYWNIIKEHGNFVFIVSLANDSLVSFLFGCIICILIAAGLVMFACFGALNYTVDDS